MRMNQSVNSTYVERLAQRMTEESGELAQRWLDRLAELLPLDAQAIFPSAELLDHVPDLIEQIAAYLSAPADLEIAANTSVIRKAQELGHLRHHQRASVHQILREYDILADLLEQFVLEETRKLPAVGSLAWDCLGLMQRLGHAVRTLLQTTIDTFVSEYTLMIDEQTAKLESFNRMLMHELRDPLGALVFAVDLLNRSETVDDKDSHLRLIALIRRNLERSIDVLRGLAHLVFAERAVDAPNQQRASVYSVATEVARQLADMAETRGVDIRIDPELPTLITDPAQLELVLMNLVTNAIKYGDPMKRHRFVEVAQTTDMTPNTRTICVRDNGIGIPAHQLGLVFKRFFRGHRERDEELKVEGSGLGLAIVEESVRMLGGRIRVHSIEGEGTAFYVTLPDRTSTEPVDADDDSV